MSTKKKIGLIILFFITFLLLFGAWYKYKYSMDVADEFQINLPEYNRKLVIATQSSEFKNIITNNIINHFETDSIFIKVIDVSSLPQVHLDEYNAMVLIHTWENWKPPTEVEKFIKNTTINRYKIIVLTTSGQGSYKMDGVDAITGESKLDETSFVTKAIIDKLNPLLDTKE